MATFFKYWLEDNVVWPPYSAERIKELRKEAEEEEARENYVPTGTMLDWESGNMWNGTRGRYRVALAEKSGYFWSDDLDAAVDMAFNLKLQTSGRVLNFSVCVIDDQTKKIRLLLT